MPRKYDVAIIGSGPAGYVSAIRLRQLNKNVCVIDFDESRLGGVCLNEGCIPVKSLLYSSKLFSDIKRAGDFGLEAEAKLISSGKISVELKDGFIVTDRKMRTAVKSIYAAGDVVNTPMYAHVAYREGIVAAEDIAGLETAPIDYDNVPNVVFSEPQVASIGITESRARELEKDIAVSKHFFRANGLAVATHGDEGFIKIVADKKTRKILGVHIIGTNAAEILHEFVVAKNSGLKIGDIAKAVHAHPTFLETAADAAKAVFDKSIHG